MDADSFNKVLDGISKIAWPAIALGVLLIFAPVFRQAFSTRPFKIKVGDMEIDVQEATNQITKQIQDLQSNVADLKSDTNTPKMSLQRSQDLGVHILWVDDKPENNAFEIASVRAEGADITEVESTQKALRLIELNPDKYDVILSDMGRQEGPRFNRTAGLDLLRELRSRGIQTPFYFYSTSQALKGRIDEVKREGAAGATASPVELVRLLRERSQVPSSS